MGSLGIGLVCGRPEKAVPFQDGDYLDVPTHDSVDDPITAFKDLSDVFDLKLRDTTTGAWGLDGRPGPGLKPCDEPAGVLRMGSTDVPRDLP